MNNNNPFDQIEQLTQTLIAPDCNGIDAQRCTEQLANILGEISGTQLHSEKIQGGSTNTSGGVALSPFLAAKCITLAARTQQFFRGVNQFFNEMAMQNKSLDILYAGCGPYATLMLPLLCVHRHQAVNLILLDIHKHSVEAAVTLFEAAQLPKVRFNGVVADATCWQPEDDTTKFDLIASETMNMALKREPQVAIFTHLQQFLKPQGALIPQQISIIASLFNRDEFHNIGPFFRLNKESSGKFKRQNQPVIAGEIVLPENGKNTATSLLISTEIQTYGEHFIYPNETDITADNQYHYLDFSQCHTIAYRYTINDSPGFEFQLPKYHPPLPPQTQDIATRSGIPYLYLFWHSVVWGFHKPRLTEVLQNLELSLQWDKVLTLFDACNADVQESIAQVLVKHPPNFVEFEDWFITKYGALSSSEVTELNLKLAKS